MAAERRISYFTDLLVLRARTAVPQYVVTASGQLSCINPPEVLPEEKYVFDLLAKELAEARSEYLESRRKT